MKKGMVAPHSLPPVPGFDRPAGDYVNGSNKAQSDLPTRRDVLRELALKTDVDETVLVASTGYCGRELYALDDRPNQLYMVGSMGCAASLDGLIGSFRFR